MDSYILCIPHGSQVTVLDQDLDKKETGNIFHRLHKTNDRPHSGSNVSSGMSLQGNATPDSNCSIKYLNIVQCAN